MSATYNLGLPFDEPVSAPALSDADARAAAVDPTRNVVLEASAGTGKTRVLVERYVNLLRAGVDPEHILAITFTRKAAAEMRERIVERLREASRLSQFDKARWRELKDRLGDISISTIDAFCLALLREFPLEADVDPGFELADDTEVPRLIDEALGQALRICRGVASQDEDVALVFAQLGERRLRSGLATLLDRRLVAPQALRRYLARGPRDLTAEIACRNAAERLRTILAGRDLNRFLMDGPRHHPHFAMLADDIRRVCAGDDAFSLQTRGGRAEFRAFIDRLRNYFLTQDGRPRNESFTGTPFKAGDCDTEDAWKRHRRLAWERAAGVAEAIRAFRRDLNVVMSRGVWRIFAVALQQYQRTLEARGLLDFSGVLERAVQLLKDLDEFAASRFRIETRYRHVLVDEFQDTSRAQWELVAQLVRNWGEGFGASTDALAPSIFVVGDRKQSIYGFRDADVAVLDEAAGFIHGLRGTESPRRAISVSFRSVPGLLSFTNAVFDAVEKLPDRADGFRYADGDRFEVAPAPATETGEHVPVGIIAAESAAAAADRVAAEVARVLESETVRDRVSGVRRRATPPDIAILFRSRDSHREFERALARRGIGTYVYKGLGFFEADEVQDAMALLRYLAEPTSNLRAAALLRSRLVRLSDSALVRLAPALADAILGLDEPEAIGSLSADDARMLRLLRAHIPDWLMRVDRQTPAELLGELLSQTAYAWETRGPRRPQARENIKKLRAMVARFQNRGYATLARVADHLDQLAVGDESNAAIDARDAVSLMTVHAAKGLEFPIVFIVNLGRGTGNSRAPIRVGADGRGESSVAIADYQSEADEDAALRDREETKRLLYVALTRARDFLYLSTTIKDGRARMGPGSLGSVLPESLRQLFERAFTLEPGSTVEWNASMTLVAR